MFRRLRREKLDWIYTFPRLHCIRFEREEPKPESPEAYSPSEAFAQAQVREADDAEFARLQDEM